MKTQRAQHNQRGGASMNPIVFYISGAALIAIGATVLHDFAPPILAGIDFNLGKMVANIGVVLIFIQVINIFFYKPLSDAIHERTTELETTFSHAEQLKEEMNSMKREYEARLASTEAEARSQIQSQIKDAQALRQKITSEAQDKCNLMLNQAQDEISMERQRVMNQMRLEVVNLTMAATEKVIGANMDTEINRNLVKEFIDTLEVKS